MRSSLYRAIPRFLSKKNSELGMILGTQAEIRKKSQVFVLGSLFHGAVPFSMTTGNGRITVSY